MRRRNKPRKYRLPNWLQWLKRLWRSLVKALRVFFIEDLEKDKPSRSPRSPIEDQSNLNGALPNSIPRPSPFLLGLDDIPNLESLTTQELIEQIEWNVESQEIVTAKEEDLNLLEDLLVNFPDS